MNKIAICLMCLWASMVSLALLLAQENQIIQPMPAIQPTLPVPSAQIVLVLTPDWDNFHGKLFLLVRNDKAWRLRPETWPVTVGKKGLGWGRGLLPVADTSWPSKKEGDGKAPAGLFYVEKRLYGYAEKPATGVTLPYRQLTADWLGVDDPKSRYYNRIVQKSQIITPDWDSYEEMRRHDDLYKWLLVVEHNTAATVPGAGSCIFIHLWRHGNAPTAGCTAMSEENLLRLATWLDADQVPLLLQLPVMVYGQYQTEWQLPMVQAFDNGK